MIEVILTNFYIKIGGIKMHLFSAVKKIIKIKKPRSYVNSDLILTVKEKQALAVGISLFFFPIFIGTLILVVQ